MGIAHHEQKLLEKFPPKGDVLTLGRQSYKGGFAEDLILSLGASSVESLDYSDFEGATHTGDLNEPIDLGKQFDTIIDFGTTEHVFNVAQALKNCVRLCRIGGQILHAVPSNGDCGHGFWQMSPELFFSLYSENNGFTETQVFIADLMDEKHWWRASKPDAGDRLTANSMTTTYVLVHTVKQADRPLSVSQSDYEHAWEVGEARRGGRFDWARNMLKASPLRHVGSIAYRSLVARTGLTRFNPHLHKTKI